ncbi:Predicted oxidoreductase [Microbacterium sp. cf046]|uniref:aldo/keto reductase n=1 Tax=Microbacterium sp. cf046 TaxID=1761803 RepID=UPI0008EE055A|nr:aldo/keto reductase [Microbacterium sp. cf046]SFS00401.1 Predicted oxidoreductase [Microbacterium sp. cf046]
MTISDTPVPLRRVGASGLLVSAVGLGCNNFGRPGTKSETLAGTIEVLDAAIDSGVTFLDTADMYGGEPGQSETLMGDALQGRRDRVVLATKFGHPGRDMGYATVGAKTSRSYIRTAVEASLRRLKTDWIDLYQLHVPDADTPIAETISALDDLVAAGKIRYYGHSNMSGWQIAEADFTAADRGSRFISAQNHYSLLARGAEREVLPAVQRFGLGFFPYFPLQNGLLTGKFTREGGPEGSRIMMQRRHVWQNAPWDALERYQAFCDERGITMLAATFGWLLSRPSLSSVIAGATSADQVRSNAAAAAAWTPSAAELATIDELFPLPDDPAA